MHLHCFIALVSGTALEWWTPFFHKTFSQLMFLMMEVDKAVERIPLKSPIVFLLGWDPVSVKTRAFHDVLHHFHSHQNHTVSLCTLWMGGGVTLEVTTPIIINQYKDNNQSVELGMDLYWCLIIRGQVEPNHTGVLFCFFPLICHLSICLFVQWNTLYASLIRHSKLQSNITILMLLPLGIVQ